MELKVDVSLDKFDLRYELLLKPHNVNDVDNSILEVRARGSEPTRLLFVKLTK